MKINPTNLHPSAFISSTFLDLKEERSAVAKVLAEAGFNINALDVRPASNSTSKVEIVNGIQASDFIVLLVGNRYGSILPQMTKSDKISITEWEYRVARYRFNKDVLVFFKNISDNSLKYSDEENSDFSRKQKELARFKSIISRTHNPKFFSNAFELTEEVAKALIPTYRTGVINLSSKVDRLEQENDKLRQQVKDLSNQEGRSLMRAYSEPSDIFRGVRGLSKPTDNLPNLGVLQNNSGLENNKLDLLAPSLRGSNP